MKQGSAKKHWERSGFGILFSLIVAVLFVVAAKMPSGAKAQELIPVIQDSTSATEETNVSAEQLLEALKSGGLFPNGNFDIKESKTSEAAVDSKPVSESDSESVQEFASSELDNLNSDTFEYLEAQGGLVAGAATAKADSSQPTIFKLAAKFLDEVIFRNSTEFLRSAKFDEGFEVSGQPIFDQDTAGYAIIKKGNQSVQVDFGKKYKAAPVVTASLSVKQYDDPEVRLAAEDLLLISDVKYVVTNVTPEGFEIMMDRVSDSDVPFSWHALAVRDPNIFKKEAKDRKSNDSQNESGGLSVSGNVPQSSNSIMGIIGQSTDSSSPPVSSGENGSSAPAGGTSQNTAPAGLSGNNSSP